VASGIVAQWPKEPRAMPAFRWSDIAALCQQRSQELERQSRETKAQSEMLHQWAKRLAL
jgi:hypothetical protein